MTGGRGNTMSSAPPAARKGDTSKYTCYKCGKVGHIASDPKCPQYNKPKQRRIFATQVIDDRSDTDHADRSDTDQVQSDQINASEESGEEPENKGQNELPAEGEYPDGSQYEDEELPYNDFDGYVLPSEEDEPVYIQAMNEDETSASTVPPEFDDVDWKSR
jgi:Zinc knuckle